MTTWRRKGSWREKEKGREEGGRERGAESPEERKGGCREAVLAGMDRRVGVRSASSSSKRTDGTGGQGKERHLG